LLLLATVYLATALEYMPKDSNLDLASFEEYATFWNKTYSAEEKSQRFHNFLMAGHKIQELNTNSQSARFGFTQFADMSTQEFRDTMLGFVRSGPVLNTLTNKRSTLDVAQMAAIDWVAAGKTTAVKNQNNVVLAGPSPPPKPSNPPISSLVCLRSPTSPLKKSLIVILPMLVATEVTPEKPFNGLCPKVVKKPTNATLTPLKLETACLLNALLL